MEDEKDGSAQKLHKENKRLKKVVSDFKDENHSLRKHAETQAVMLEKAGNGIKSLTEKCQALEAELAKAKLEVDDLASIKKNDSHSQTLTWRELIFNEAEAHHQDCICQDHSFFEQLCHDPTAINDVPFTSSSIRQALDDHPIEFGSSLTGPRPISQDMREKNLKIDPVINPTGALKQRMHDISSSDDD